MITKISAFLALALGLVLFTLVQMLAHNLKFKKNSNRQSSKKLSSAKVEQALFQKRLNIFEINSNKRTYAACSGN